MKYSGKRDKIRKELENREKYGQLSEDANELVSKYSGVDFRKFDDSKEMIPMGSVTENFQKIFREEREEGKKEGIKEEKKNTQKARKEADSAKKAADEARKEIQKVIALKEAGIREVVLDNLSENEPSDIAVSQLKRFFFLSEKEAKDYTIKYGYKRL